MIIGRFCLWFLGWGSSTFLAYSSLNYFGPGLFNCSFSSCFTSPSRLEKKSAKNSRFSSQWICIDDKGGYEEGCMAESVAMEANHLVMVIQPILGQTGWVFHEVYSSLLPLEMLSSQQHFLLRSTFFQTKTFVFPITNWLNSPSLIKSIGYRSYGYSYNNPLSITYTSKFTTGLIRTLWDIRSTLWWIWLLLLCVQ